MNVKRGSRVCGLRASLSPFTSLTPRSNTGTLTRILKKMAHVQLSSGFSTWRSRLLVQDEARSKLKILEMTIERIRHRNISMALRKWQELLRNSRHRQRVLSRVLKRIAHSRTAAAFSAWKSRLVEDEARKRQLRRLEITARALKNSTLLQAWHTWTSFLSRSNHQQELISRVVLRLSHLQLSAAFNKWAVRHRKFLRDQHVFRTMLRICGHVLHKKLAVTWNTWTSFIRRSKQQEEKFERRQNEIRRLMRSVVRRFKNRNLSRAMTTWKREVSESRNLDLLALKKRQVLKMLLGKKHVTRIMNLRIAFQQIKTACQIVHFQSRVKDQYVVFAHISHTFTRNNATRL